MLSKELSFLFDCQLCENFAKPCWITGNSADLSPKYNYSLFYVFSAEYIAVTGNEMCV